jgi:phage major head subunit gpT-like protein
VRTSSRITGSTWYLIGKKNQLGPVAVQQRKRGVLTRMDRETDENTFMRGEYLYGTEARGESFLTLPFLAYAGGLNSVAAWAAV